MFLRHRFMVRTTFNGLAVLSCLLLGVRKKIVSLELIFLRNMIFLSWVRPSPQEQKTCISKSGAFNYDTNFKGASAMPLSFLEEDRELSKGGFLINRSRTIVGSGFETYEKGKAALQNWRHFGLKWAFVDPNTPIQSGVKFCVCVKEFLPWVMLPLQVVYVKERRDTDKVLASFGFGSGTLQGHLLGRNTMEKLRRIIQFQDL